MPPARTQAQKPLPLPLAPLGPERAFEVGKTYLVTRAGVERPATILNSRRSKLGVREAYISFAGEDKRLDTWVPASTLGDEVPTAGPSRPRLSAADGGDTAANGSGSPAPGSERSTPEREHEAVTRVRNFEDVRFGEYLIRTWYYSPYPMPLEGPTDPGAGKRGRPRKRKLEGEDPKPKLGTRSASELLAAGVGKGGEGAMGRMWVCELCFKYMRTRAAWDMHKTGCKMNHPPGRKVYQRYNYSIWEVDGAEATLYCQNLCLFGKLFIDHKSVYFHTENFLFYVLCDARTSKMDQVMTFFSKEKYSYDDYNLACIITFPPFQNRGFGKLLIEFSYYLTRHPATRFASGNPGTPERPLSDLGLKGYMAYWVSVVLRFCRTLLGDAPAEAEEKPPPPQKEGRSLRTRKPPPPQVPKETAVVNGVEFVKEPDAAHKGHSSAVLTLAQLAQACHLRTEDVEMVLAELGFLRYRRALPPSADVENDDSEERTEWTDVEVVIARDMVDEQWARWGVRPEGVLDEQYCLL